MSLNDTFGSILGLTFEDSSVTTTSSFSFPFDIVVELALGPLTSAETEDVECLFDLDLVAARILCSKDDRKRLNVLSWISGLTGGSEVLDEVDTELFLGLISRAALKGLESASCVRRCRTADVMYVEHLKRREGKKGGESQYQYDDGGKSDWSLRSRKERRGVRIQGTK